MWTRLGNILHNISISLITAIRFIVFIYICVCAVMMEGLSSSWSNAVMLFLYAENNIEALGNATTGKNHLWICQHNDPWQQRSKIKHIHWLCQYVASISHKTTITLKLKNYSTQLLIPCYLLDFCWDNSKISLSMRRVSKQ